MFTLHIMGVNMITVTAKELLDASIPVKFAVDLEQATEIKICYKCGNEFKYHKHARHIQCWRCRKAAETPEQREARLTRCRAYDRNRERKH